MKPGVSARFDEPLLLFAAAGLYPAVFSLARNWFTCNSPSEILFLLICSPAASVFLGALLRWVLRGCCGAGRWLRAEKYFCATYALAVAAFLLQNPFSMLFAGGIPVVFAYAALPLFVFLWFLLVRKAGLAPLTVGLLALSAVSSGEWAFSYSNGAKLARELQNCPPEASLGIKFKAKPNVYYFTMESYSSPEAMKELYGIDNDMGDRLRRRGFTVYKDFYSNYPNTLLSLFSVFAMHNRYWDYATEQSDAVGARKFLGGKYCNPVLSIFRDNGYQLRFIFNSAEIFTPGPDLAYYYPDRPVAYALSVYGLQSVYRALGGIFYTGWESWPGERFIARLKEQAPVIGRDPRPSFVFLRPAALAHEDSMKPLKPYGELVRGYKIEVAGMNNQLLELVDCVIAGDPGALIILMGDHGRYRGILNPHKDAARAMAEYGMTPAATARDYFSVLLAIKYPAGIKPQSGVKSGVNLFRSVFFALSGDERLAAGRQPDLSYMRARGKFYVTVDSGKPLESWREFVP